MQNTIDIPGRYCIRHIFLGHHRFYAFPVPLEFRNLLQKNVFALSNYMRRSRHYG
jgi:hypothetical protein